MPRHGITVKKRVAKDGRESFHIRYSNGGQLQRETFPTEELAKERVAEINYFREIRRFPAKERALKVTVDDHIVDWWARKKDLRWKPGTAKSYKPMLGKWVGPYIGDMLLGTVSVEVVDAYIGRMRKAGAGAPTINKVLDIMEGVFNDAIKRGYEITNPFASVERLAHTARRPTEKLTLLDVLRLVKNMTPKDGLAVLLISIGALRQQECFVLRWRDLIDREGQVVKDLALRYSISGGEIVHSTKSEAGDREYELPKLIRELIADVYALHGKPNRSSLVFVTTQQARMTHQVFNRNRLAPAQRALGMIETDEEGKPKLYPEKHKYAGKQIPLYTPHDLRDLAASLAIKAGWDLDSLKDLYGHSSITTTEKHYWNAVTKQKGKPIVSIDEQLRLAWEKVGQPSWRERVVSIDFDIERVAVGL